MEGAYFRKGFGLKGEIEGLLTADYHSGLIDAFKNNRYALSTGKLTFRLAREFGFCYGVDRAVEYAYETRAKFPERQLYLVGEIIHNPHVNRKLESMGVRFLHRADDGSFDFSSIRPDDVVILPAFGVTIGDFERLRASGAVLVDTTCGSVLNVWKRVERYARDGFTAIIHGKHWHEETKATASQVTKHSRGRYLVVLDMAEAREVCDFIEHGGDPAEMATRFGPVASEGFDFATDLERVGVANQTTMLSSESLAIAEELRQTMIRRYGAEQESERIRTFDTICSATQERQDAVVELLDEPLDVMVVVGATTRATPPTWPRCAGAGGGHLPHRGRRVHRSLRRGHPPQAQQRSGRGAHLGLARGRGPDRDHGGGVDPEQQDRRDRGADLPLGRGESGRARPLTGRRARR
ncbi:MAG: hypothetical protein R2909_01820 [Gemmatimonadales bacterium]